MATLEQLEALEDQDQLIRVEVTLPEDGMASGRVYITPELKPWIQESVSRKARRGGFSEYQLLLILMKDIILGRRLTRGETHPCHPKGHRIWELKVGATRIFGYFPCKNVFVGVIGANKDNDLPDNDAYTPFIQRAKQHYEKHGLQPLKEENINAVL